MLKMDGLTCSLSYDKFGELVKAETRGNGEIGEDILKNAKLIKNIPLRINNAGIPLTVDGEVIITREDFDKINKLSNVSHIIENDIMLDEYLWADSMDSEGFYVGF